ncbi:MAG: glycosyltransferase family 4 protein [Bacteroidales bacterium]|nr:glycosyltransferase family 4 protein [Bacteroidales bacterium]
MILFVIIKDNPFISSSASANRWLTLIEGLSNLGTKIELLVYGGYQSEKEAKEWKTGGNISGVNIKYIAPQLIEGYWKLRYYTYIGSTFREGKLINLIQKELESNEGIVWTDSSYFGFKLAVKLRKFMPNQKIFLEMSEFLDIKHKGNKINFLQRLNASKRKDFFERKAFYVYDGLALMTKTLFNHYTSFPQPHPRFIHLPMTVDPERFSSNHEPLKEFVKPYIAFVGVMNDAKDGVNILIKAFDKIASQFPQYKLYLIGPWQYDTPNHMKMIKDNGLSDRVFWMKEYSRDSIPTIIKNADLLVLPRPDSKQAQGGFPTKLGEYLATGNPVCATTVGEISDYLTDGESVYFAEPGSVDTFAYAMKRALSNPNEAKRIGATGRKVAEMYFNKDIQSKILLDFLKEIYLTR